MSTEQRKKNITQFLYIGYFLISDLPDASLYPTVTAVYGNTEVSMVYIGAPIDG